LAQALEPRKDLEGARSAAEQAAGYHRRALESSPESPKYRRYLWEDYYALAWIRLKLRDSAGAAKDAEELPRIWPENPKSYVLAAWFLVQGAQASPEQGSDHYDRAIHLLRMGVDQQKLDRKWLDDPLLGALRDREDFRRLRQTPKPPVAG
jgi:hypothetical protein